MKESRVCFIKVIFSGKNKDIPGRFSIFFTGADGPHPQGEVIKIFLHYAMFWRSLTLILHP